MNIGFVKKCPHCGNDFSPPENINPLTKYLFKQEVVCKICKNQSRLVNNPSFQFAKYGFYIWFISVTTAIVYGISVNTAFNLFSLVLAIVSLISGILTLLGVITISIEKQNNNGV